METAQRAISFTKSRQGSRPANSQHDRSRDARPRVKILGPSLEDQALAPTAVPVYTMGSRAQDGVNLGTVVQKTRKGPSSDGVEPGHTPRPRVRSKGAHAVEFSKTVAPLSGRDFLLSGTPPNQTGSRGRPMSIAPERWVAKLSSDILTRPADRAPLGRSNIAAAWAESALLGGARRGTPSPRGPFASSGAAVDRRALCGPRPPPAPP